MVYSFVYGLSLTRCQSMIIIGSVFELPIYSLLLLGVLLALVSTFLKTFQTLKIKLASIADFQYPTEKDIIISVTSI